jgi:riboflavin kinase/FMN adenylyltransferase
LEVIRGLGESGEKFQKTVVTIGAFDGIHLGHQKIIKEVTESAKKSVGRSVVVTFDPHPSEIVADTPAPVLLSLPRKINLLEELGIEACLIVNFNRKFSYLSPQDFIREVLAGYLKARVVIIGYNYVFGKGRAGNAELLSEMGSKYGFSVKQVEPVKIGGEVVSSTRIREAVDKGDFVKANSFLGRPYEITGKVEKGEARGRIIGFPTANLDIPRGLLPPPGVYAGFAVVGGKQYRAALNLGCRPTFSPGGACPHLGRLQESPLREGDRKGRPSAPIAEVHVLEFNGSIYGEELTFYFLKKIRDEIAFSNPDELKKQIGKDIEKL